MSAAQIAQRLGSTTREGRNCRCRCPIHNGASLYLRDGQDGRLLVYCWAGCNSSAVLAELRRLGLLDDDRRPQLPPRPAPPKPKPADLSNERLALRIWGEAVDPRGTLVERCLVVNRKSAIPHRAEEALRFHPRCPFKDERVPAMIGLLRDIRTDEPCGIHRTALLPDGSDRDRSRGKAMLGRASGAAIKLSPDDEVTLGLGICEGIETGLALSGMDWRPIWAVGSAGAIAQFPVLSGIEELTIFADNDKNGVGQRAAEECRERWLGAGQAATIAKAIP
jgi:putative DNA primase/helicase